MAKWIEKSEKILDKIVDIQQFISNLFLVFIMTIITFDVLGRNLLNKPLKGTYELTELGAALLVFFALAITHRKGEHITIDFIVDKFSAKAKNMLLGVVEIVIAVILFIMSKHLFDNGLRMMERKSTTTDLAISVHPFLFIITFTLIIFALTAIFKAIHYFGLAVNKK
ncbi:TRAP transporter small permease [Pseudogracilibacillus sp. SO30301A]|uniref:TRAP transporter small permease n=1 Tax=Pseudogracilibacillus sp. SO30301A TaxID=3098291 RepID=UPI00300E08B8